jgi:hypothetical protein
MGWTQSEPLLKRGSGEMRWNQRWGKIHGAHIMPITPKGDNRPNGVRDRRESTSAFFSGSGIPHTIEPALVPPAADSGARFDVELLEDVLHVLLHRARTASDYLRDLAVAFPFSDPFHHFKLTLRQRTRLDGNAPLGSTRW